MATAQITKKKVKLDTSKLTPAQQKLVQERAKRLLADKAHLQNQSTFDPNKLCFDRQLKFINDKSPFKVAVTSRRAGKTTACAIDLINTCLTKRASNSLYITLSRNNAKKIIWKDLQNIIHNNSIPGVKFHEADLTITFPNRSTIFLAGAKDESEVQKFRGFSFQKVYIDEAQSFKSFISMLIDDVLVPALYDTGGSLTMIGTPGPLCYGFYYEASQSDSWSVHHWSMLHNPYIELKSGKKVEEILRSERERRGIDETDPTYRRESLGEWVEDSKSLVYQFNRTRNCFTSIDPNIDYQYVFGIDIGYEDADAIVVLAYSEFDDCVYVVEEHVQNKQTISALSKQILRLQKKYAPIKMVADSGALGKKIVEELRQRFALNVFPAEKARKNEFIMLLNDALRQSKLKVRPASRLVDDWNMLTWKKAGDKRIVNPNYHSDIADAALYAWRECRAFQKQELIERPAYGSVEEQNEWLAKQDNLLANPVPWWEQ